MSAELTVLIVKLLNSVQEFIEIEALAKNLFK